jgi:hypothetical protein
VIDPKFKPRPPATLESIAEAEKSLNRTLPHDYVAFLAAQDGGEGWIGKSFTRLWSVAELATSNLSYEVEKWVPGLLIFGSDGGNEAFGFDYRQPAVKVVRIPFIVMDWVDAKPFGENFDNFLEELTVWDG